MQVSTKIPENDINNASNDEWNNLINNLRQIDWDSKININTDVDTITNLIINNLEQNVKDNLRKKTNFKDNPKANGEKFKSRSLIPREVHINLTRKSEGHEKLRKVMVLSKYLSHEKKILEADINLKKFYDKRAEKEEKKIFEKSKVDKNVLFDYIKHKNRTKALLDHFMTKIRK